MSNCKRFLFLLIAACSAIVCYSQEIDSIAANQVQQLSQEDINRAKELATRGMGLYTGRNGYRRDFEKAREALLEAARLNNADAECILAHMYENGNGVEQDYSKAFEWYMKAARKNSVRAQSSVAFFYDEGMGVEQSFVEAAKWYQKAAENNDGASQYNLADMYTNGIGVEKDYDKALELYRKAMTNGVREASREISKVTALKNSQAAGNSNHGDQFYINPSVMPEYPGGNSAVLKYLNENIVYPKSARENRVEGRVVVSFTIKKDGYISDPEVVRSVSPDLDNEALRVISAMTARWTPGYVNGEPVNVRFSIPINFRLK